VLVLSKPLGVGAVLAARQRGSGSPRQLAQAVATMTELNREAAAAALRAGVHAMTDVTGFGLLGHLHHMCRESGFAAEVDAASVPALDGVEELLSSGLGSSGGSRRNASWVAPFVRFDGVVERWRRALLVDATTSGGLLAAVPAAHAGEAVGVPIGRLREGPAGFVHVR
jgi:selenide,water dikinase